jgi:hypothetical protein
MDSTFKDAETDAQRLARLSAEGLVASTTAETVDAARARRSAEADAKMTDPDLAKLVQQSCPHYADSDVGLAGALAEYERLAKEKDAQAKLELPPPTPPLAPSPMTITPPGEQPSGTAEAAPTTVPTTPA